MLISTHQLYTLIVGVLPYHSLAPAGDPVESVVEMVNLLGWDDMPTEWRAQLEDMRVEDPWTCELLNRFERDFDSDSDTDVDSDSKSDSDWESDSESSSDSHAGAESNSLNTSNNPSHRTALLEPIEKSDSDSDSTAGSYHTASTRPSHSRLRGILQGWESDTESTADGEFAQQSQLLDSSRAATRDWPRRLVSQFRQYVPKELKPLIFIIRGLMRYRPEDRISARQALGILDWVELRSSMRQEARVEEH
jgi:hypothetical protein